MPVSLATRVAKGAGDWGSTELDFFLNAFFFSPPPFRIGGNVLGRLAPRTLHVEGTLCAEIDASRWHHTRHLKHNLTAEHLL